jgi:hypothetical protein
MRSDQFGDPQQRPLMNFLTAVGEIGRREFCIVLDVSQELKGLATPLTLEASAPLDVSDRAKPARTDRVKTGHLR